MGLFSAEFVKRSTHVWTGNVRKLGVELMYFGITFVGRLTKPRPCEQTTGHFIIRLTTAQVQKGGKRRSSRVRWYSPLSTGSPHDKNNASLVAVYRRHPSLEHRILDKD